MANSKLRIFNGIQTGASPLLIGDSSCVDCSNVRLNNKKGSLNNDVGMEKWSSNGTGNRITAIHQFKDKKMCFISDSNLNIGAWEYWNGKTLGSFNLLNLPSLTYSACTCDLNGDMLFTVENGYIYKLINGENSLTPLNQTSRKWFGITADIYGNVYANVYADSSATDIYKQTEGTGDFQALNQLQFWRGRMSSDLDGNVYSCQANNIFKKSFDDDDFLTLGLTSYSWTGVTVNIDGQMYGVAYGNYIYKIKGTSLTVELMSVKDWRGIAHSPNGDLFACCGGYHSSPVIFKKDFLTGVWSQINPSGVSNWFDCASDLMGNIYAIGDTRIYRALLK